MVVLSESLIFKKAGVRYEWRHDSLLLTQQPLHGLLGGGYIADGARHVTEGRFALVEDVAGTLGIAVAIEIGVPLPCCGRVGIEYQVAATGFVDVFLEVGTGLLECFWSQEASHVVIPERGM